jgi:hypothetical protein
VTLRPIDNLLLVRAVKGEPYKVGPHCANPKCKRYADHAHHIFRRSMLGGNYAWVEVDGWTTGNLTGLCAACHDDITGRVGGHKAAIRLEDKTFIWCSLAAQTGKRFVFVPVGPLDPQPPTSETLTTERALGRDEESEHCPLCGHTTRRRRETPPSAATRRRRKSWTVSVPDDAENGAEILDTFVDEVALLLGAGEWSPRNRRYWALVHALAWTMQQREQFARDVKAAA